MPLGGHVGGRDRRPSDRPSRRRVLAGGVALGAVAALPAAAQPLALAPDHHPARVLIDPTTPAGEIYVLPDRFWLFWTLEGGEAIRYTVGIGRPGLYQAGLFTVGNKREWPSWTPTPAMIEREPERYARWADGMPGGPDNPLGARALYLHDEAGRDTLLRIHGTNDPDSIGTAVSNGCARLTNEHITELYDLVPLGTPVLLLPQGA